MKTLTRMIRCLLLSSCLALSGGLSTTIAADLPGEQQSSTEPVTPSPYTGSFTIYGFLPTFNGHAGINGLGPVNVGISQGELLDILDFAVMITGDIRRDKIGLFADLIYLDVSDTAATPGPLFSNARIELDATLLTIAPTYQLYETEKGWLQGMAGIRWWSFDLGVDIRPGILPGISGNGDINFIDPIIGVRGHLDVTEKVFLSGTAVIGGFGAGSDFMWDVVGTIGYKFNERWSAHIGYRGIDVDFKKGGDVVDLNVPGPIAGLTVSF